MKNKLLIVLTSLFISIFLVGCGKEKVKLDDIVHMRYLDLVHLAGTRYELDVEYVHTAQYYPNTVIGYADHKAGDMVPRGSKVKV